VETNFATRSSRTLGSAITHNHTGVKGDTSTLTPTWASYTDTFNMSLKQADNSLYNADEQMFQELSNTISNFMEGYETTATAYLFNNRSLTQDIEHFAHVSFNKPIGVELDLDAIALMPSSAFTPSGFTVNDARKYIHTIAKRRNISYLHLSEGAPTTSAEMKIVGKSIAYLVSDFIKQNTFFF
jgi:hypothetical protein